MDGLTAPDNHFGPNPGALLNIIFQFTSGGRGQERCQGASLTPLLAIGYELPVSKDFAALFSVLFSRSEAAKICSNAAALSFFVVVIVVVLRESFTSQQGSGRTAENFHSKKLARPSFTAPGLLQVATEAKGGRAVQG